MCSPEEERNQREIIRGRPCALTEGIRTICIKAHKERFERVDDAVIQAGGRLWLRQPQQLSNRLFCPTRGEKLLEGQLAVAVTIDPAKGLGRERLLPLREGRHCG